MQLSFVAIAIVLALGTATYLAPEGEPQASSTAPPEAGLRSRAADIGASASC